MTRAAHGQPRRTTDASGVPIVRLSGSGTGEVNVYRSVELETGPLLLNPRSDAAPANTAGRIRRPVDQERAARDLLPPHGAVVAAVLACVLVVRHHEETSRRYVPHPPPFGGPPCVGGISVPRPPGPCRAPSP